MIRLGVIDRGAPSGGRTPPFLFNRVGFTRAAAAARKIKLSILPDDGCDGASGCEMTRAKRAWRKANAYVRSGQHAKAIYWLSRTQAILDGDRPRRPRFDDWKAGYMLAAVMVFVVLWVAGG